LAKDKRASFRTGAGSVPARDPRTVKANPPEAARSNVVQHQLAANDSASSKTANAASPTSPLTPSKNPATRLRIWWSNATRWTKAIFAALAGLATIIAAVPVIVNALQTSKNTVSKSTVLSRAEADANTLNSLKAGELFSAFQGSLKTSPTANVWGRAVQITTSNGSDLISDYLFILRTVYVEAFVGRNGAVDAYTITARTADMPQGINILGANYDLGNTTLANAPLPEGIMLVADVYSAHITAYYEVSGTSEADLDQTVAVGITIAGSLPNNYKFPNIPANTDSLALAAGAPGYNPQSGYYRIEERFATPAYLASSLNLRRQMLINAVTITAPGYPVAPEMISLHPEEVAQFSS
jgi:hypothetical protein